MMSDMKKFDVKVRLVVISFCKFMKSRGVSLDETIEMVEKAWGHED
jgi:hypothetical protein